MDSLTGGGAEILVDETRLKHRSKVRSGEWLEIMETAHELGIPTTATMMLGHGETAVDRLRHLEEIRKLQDRTGQDRTGREVSLPSYWGLSSRRTCRLVRPSRTG